MNSLDKQIADIFNGTHTMSSDEVAKVSVSCHDEIRTVEKALEADKAVMLDIAVTGDELEATRQRVASAELHRDRLQAAIPRLEKHVEDLKRTERDERQRAEYTALVKRRAANKKEIEEFKERVAAHAYALHEAVKLQVEAKRFNVRPTPGIPVNPKDVMVSEYENLAPYVTDAFVKGTRLVATDGRVLFSPPNASVSTPPPIAHAPQAMADKPYLGEELQQAKDKRTYDQVRLQKLQQDAAQRGAPALEQVAAAQGITGDQLRLLEDSANGKTVAAIQQKIDVEMELREQNARG